MRSRLVIPLGSILLLLAACGGASPGTTTSGPPPTSTSTTTAATTTSTEPAATTTAAPPAEATVPVLLARFTGFGPEWSELVFPYGDDEATLGTSPGGDGGSVLWGPEYGVQVADGTWWFLDAARLRLAHFSEDGGYVDQVVMPESLLVNGVYFQFQMPQALDDGSMVMSGFDRPLVRLRDGELSSTTIANSTPWVTTDGRYLYGFASMDGTPVRLDPEQPMIEPVEWFMTRDGRRYRITVAEHDVVIELPDDGLTRTLQLRFADDPEVAAWAGIEVESGADGTLFIYCYGVPTSDESLDIGGLVSVSPEGAVSGVEPTALPFTASDPGSPARLGVRPGGTTPWVMIVGEDGVRVYSKEG